MEKQARKDLATAIREAREKRALQANFNDADIAADVVQANAELWKKVKHEAAMDQLTAMVRSDVQHFKRTFNPDQYKLAFPGFEHAMSASPLLRVGRTWTPLLKSTAEPVTAEARRLRAQLEAAKRRSQLEGERSFAEQERRVTEMEKIARAIVRADKGQPGIEVEEMFRMRAQRLKARQEREERRKRQAKAR